MESHKNIEQLIANHIVLGLSEQEEKILQEWIDESAHNRQLYEKLTDKEYLSAYEQKYAEIDVNHFWKKTERIIMPRRRHILRYVGYAAAFIGVLIGSVFLWRSTPHQPQNTIITAHQETITPGGQKATLVLASGQEVDLSSVKNNTMEISGIEVSGERAVVKSASENVADKGAWNKIITPRGGEYNLVLSDGTVVYINSESCLEFPSKFTGSQREVKLQGEAYFSVSKNSNSRFIVKTNEMDIVVTGTEFNIKAYKEENTVQTTLVNGLVSIATGKDRQNIVNLVPAQQAELNLTTRRLDVKEVDIHPFIAWKNGQFIFKGDRLEDIMIVLARWYDFEVFYRNEEVKNLVFAGKINRMEVVDPILEIMESTKKVNIEVKGKTIVLSAK